MTETEWEVDGVRVWVDPGGGVTIEAVDPITARGDPMELSSTQARQVTAALLEAAEYDDAH